MQIKSIVLVTMASLCAAQLSFALPQVEDAGDAPSSTNTLSATPVAQQNQPLEIVNQAPASVQKSGSVSDTFLEKLSALEQEVQSLQGQVDELQHELKQSKTEQAQQFLILNQKMAAAPVPASIPARPVAIPAVKAAAPAKEVVAPVKAVVPTQPAALEDQEKKTYDAAYSLVSSHAYSDAIEAFSGYLEIYGAEGHYAANSNYWLGELNASQKTYPAAIKYLQVVVDQYPKSSKVPDALLKLGIINKRLGNDAKAQTWFARLMKDYPQSASAQSAKEYLA